MFRSTPKTIFLIIERCMKSLGRGLCNIRFTIEVFARCKAGWSAGGIAESARRQAVLRCPT